MAVPNNYIDKIKKDGDSRMISPAADMVRVDNDNFEGTDLDEVLDEVAQAIEEAGEGGYAPPAGGIPKTDLASDVQTSLDKADTALQSFTETDPTVPSWAKQPNKPTYTAQEVGALPADTTIPTKTSDLNNDSGFVTEAVQSVSVDTNGDGTVDINVDDDTYTINLNHTHEGMAKLVVCEESDLPATLAKDTIYAQVDDADNPTEIEVLYIAGLEFAGGGVPAGTPAITRPSGSSINLGENSGSGVSKSIEIKANSHITGDITVGLAANSDLSFDTSNLPSGVTYNSGAGTLTIAQATAILGVNITVVYSGSGAAEIDGGIVISGGGLSSPKSVVVVVVVQPLAFWDGADLPSNNKWIDKINNLPINLFGTAGHVTGGYQLNNLSSQKAAYALCDPSANTLLNQNIDKEFSCLVDCKVKFTTADYIAEVLDFGAFGVALSNISLNFRIKQNGDIYPSFKHDGNVVTGFSESVTTASSGITFPLNSYIDVQVKMGVKLLQNGKQELYIECGTGRCYAVLDTPLKVNFAGVKAGNINIDSAFALGIGYMPNADLNANASTYYADVIYKSIELYNKAI